MERKKIKDKATSVWRKETEMDKVAGKGKASRVLFEAREKKMGETDGGR